jgi:hypothetical protein
MKIRVYGYRIVAEELPKAMEAIDAHSALINNAGSPIDKKGLIRGGGTKIECDFDGKKEEWWGGLILRARDATSINELVDEDGKLTLTARQLKGRKIAEVSYYLAHPTTGNGLVAVYHTGPGVSTLEYVLRRLFGQFGKDQRSVALAQAGTDREKRKEIIESYKGSFGFSQLTREEDLVDLLKELKRISAIEFRFSTVRKTGGNLFAKLKAQAKMETERLVFPLDFVLDDDLSQEFLQGLANTDVVDASIEGPDMSTGKRRIVNSDLIRNKLLFAEDEYDTMLGDLKLDLSDWGANIEASPVIRWMKKLTKNANTRLLLSK